MKKTLLAAAALAALAFAGSASATTQLAGGTLSYNIGVTNDYVFRGLSQTDGDAALQGGVDYSRGLFYVGTWASNVSFADHELDLYAGVKPTLGKAAFDFGVIHYDYNDKAFNTTEVKAAVSYPVYKGSVGAAFYDDVDYGKYYYYEVNGSYPLTGKLSVSGALGQQTVLGDSYTTGNIGLTYAITPVFSIDARYSDTNFPETDLYKNAKPRLAVTLKAAF